MHLSSGNLATQIESWFHSHDDGEFAAIPPSQASVRIGDFTKARTIVYITKHHCLPRVQGLAHEQQAMAALARYGLPVDDDLPLLRHSSVSRIFIGDADPPDILAFAWLREHVPIDWYGVNDGFLLRHGTRDSDWNRIPLSDAEQETVPQLPRLCPDYREMLGEYCSSLLDFGVKIELEGSLMDRCAGSNT